MGNCFSCRPPLQRDIILTNNNNNLRSEAAEADDPHYAIVMWNAGQAPLRGLLLSAISQRCSSEWVVVSMCLSVVGTNRFGW
jgi:hypothetical protein